MPLTVPPMRRSPAAFSTGIGSPRDHRLVDRALALDHDAVDRHLLAGPDAEAVAHPDLLERDVLLAAVLDEPPGRLRGEAEQGLDGARGLAPGPQLQHLPEQHQRGDDGGGLEVHRDVPMWSRNEAGKMPGKSVAATL